MKELKYKEFINEILKNDYSNHLYVEQGVFDNFYVPFLSYMENKVFEFLQHNISNLKVKEDTVLESILCSSKESLIEVALKTLITEFYQKKSNERLGGTSSKEIYESYNLSLKNVANIKEILNKYEVLSYLIYQRITAKYNLIEESITNLVKDISKLRIKFNKKFSSLESISLNNGDTHNGGKSVLIFNFDNEEKLVYKPHGLEGDEALNNIYEYINDKKTLKTKLYNTNIINKGIYGWQEFIKYECCLNREEPSNYYYKIGAILAIFNILKTGDIHSENIIASKDNPALIDLETLLTNDNTEGLEDNLLLAYFLEINDSVLGCYILPQNLEYSTIDIDLSGLSGDAGKKSSKITYLELKDAGTDKIRFEKEFVVSTENNNKPIMNGKKLNALEFTSEIESGFKEVYSLIKNNKQEFLTLLYRVLNRGVYRQVLRPTFIYSKYLQASYHPKYLKTFEARLNLFNIIKDSDARTFNNNKIKNEKCLKEIESLMEDDIPYFASDFSSKALYVNSSSIIDNYFVTTIKDIITKRDINDLTMKKQVAYIRNSLLTTKEDIFHNDSYKGERIAISKDNIDFSLRSIGDYIYDRAIFNTNKTSCTYPNLNMHGNKMLIGPINYSLYDGGGLILFLYALGKELKSDKYLSLAKASLKGVEELTIQDSNTPMASSAFSGIGSLIYIYFNLSHLMNDDSFHEKYIKYINEFNNYEIGKIDSFDLIGGASGIVILALNIYKQSKDEVALSVAKKYVTYLYDHLKYSERWNYLSGFAHGYSGFALALLKAASILKNEDYYNLSLKIIKKEDSLYREDIKNWIDLRSKDNSALNYWCHGAAGILLARVKMSNYIKEEHKEIVMCKIPEALEAFIANGFKKSSNHSLCHGTLGNIDILRTIAKELNLPELENKSEKIFKECINYMAEDGVKYGLYGALGMVNFMTGISGIGYSILRKKNPTLPSVLALEVVRREMINR
ncbi:type 2 lanthipeptide synthetase LanM [Clostridium vincentii]|uniref:Lanthionine synthetase C-like protein n=1 Tax=Clostridium vincentii TaxID=52704 RepID=A0A2T0BH60_9CLOT|nr:type 2 lanthipeptide synthetase LanM [Clostridium vincentii]PRR83236.1 Lanthionine synthetase C-like protein [Clostridium vincentii]